MQFASSSCVKRQASFPQRCIPGPRKEKEISVSQQMRNITVGKTTQKHATFQKLLLHINMNGIKEFPKDPKIITLKFCRSPCFTSSKRYWEAQLTPLAISGNQPIILRLDALSLAGAALMTVPAEERHLAKSSICAAIHWQLSVLLSAGARKNYLCSLDNTNTATEYV